MLQKIYDLIFGVNEFEKVKIEIRFHDSIFLAKDININQLSDFEILEKIIYKIKEELRIKSSNLNKTISSPQRELSRKDVKQLIDILDKKKYDFLNKAFTLIKEDEKVNLQVPDEETIIEENFSEPEELSINDFNPLLIENKEYSIYLETGKVPYLLIKFNNETDLTLIKKLSSVFFDNYQMHGSNVIVEDKNVLIVPRFQNDNLIELPRVETNVEEVYEKLTQKEIENNNSEEYIEQEEVKPKEQLVNKKKEDNSLDSLLFNTNKNEPVINFSNEIINNEIKEDDSKIEKELDEGIIIEENEKQPGPVIKIKDKEIKVDTTKPEDNLESNQFELYKDDKIIAYLNNNSSVFGEIYLRPLNGKNINDLEQNDLSYITIFSKVFSSVLFETIQAHGTNLIWDSNDNKIRIIPRFQNDNVNNLKWDFKESTTDFLDQVRNKLLLEMNKELPKGTPEQNIEKQLEITENSSLKEKAEYVLKELKRIP